MENLIQAIESIDKELFILLNGLHSAQLDSIMYYATKPLSWLPVFIYFIYQIQKTKKLSFNRVALLVGFGLVIFLADRISVLAFKEVFLRFRPCHNFDLMPVTHIVKQHCGGKYGFLSSHATNFMGMAVYAIVALKPPKLVSLLLVLWAFFVGYTRIYLGVHYPLDVLCGFFLGASLGYAIAKNMLFYFIKIEKIK